MNINQIRTPTAGKPVLQAHQDAIMDIIEVLPSLQVKGDGNTILSRESAGGTIVRINKKFTPKKSSGEAGTITPSISTSIYTGTFKVIKRNIALMNPPEGGWTSENMPQPVYKITIYDACISNDILSTSSITDLQAGYAQYNGSWVLVKGKDLAFPSSEQYVVLYVDYDAQAETFLSGFELADSIQGDRTATKQIYPIAKITFSAVDESDSSSSVDSETANFNACNIFQYPLSVPQLWSFKQCQDEDESSS